MDLIQPNGQPKYGRFTEVPKSIDINQYEYKTADGEVLQGWRKRLKYKKYKFCSIQHDHYSIGIAIADMGWLGQGFIYIYDHQQQEMMEWKSNSWLSRNILLDEQPLFNHSHFIKSGYQFDIQHAHGVRYIQVTRHDEICLSARIFCAGTDPLSLCSPNGQNAWTYTQKLSTLGCAGFFLNRQGQSIQFHNQSMASLEDTCGFLRIEQTWNRIICNFWDGGQRRIGLHLASGINQDFGNENCLWINGVLYPLTDVLFQQIEDHLWQIEALDDSLCLTIETSWRRDENFNQRLLGSQYSQWQAKISGSIKIYEQDIIFLHQYGLLEQHFVKA